MALYSMQWALNSPAPMPATAIEAVMGRELAHWERVLDIRLLKNKVLQQEALAAGRSPEPEQDSPTERTETHAVVIRQMRAGIKGVAVMAADMNKPADARFHITISGHVGLDYTEGVEERLQLFVDQATEPRTGWVG